MYSSRVYAVCAYVHKLMVIVHMQKRIWRTCVSRAPRAWGSSVRMKFGHMYALFPYVYIALDAREDASVLTNERHALHTKEDTTALNNEIDAMDAREDATALSHE